MKNYWKSFGAAVAACSVALAACGDGQPRMQVRDYATKVVEKESVTLTQDYSATIRGKQDIEIFFLFF